MRGLNIRGTIIEKHLRRCTRNLLVINLCVLTAGAWIFCTWHDYFLGLLPGTAARPSWVEYVGALVLLGVGGLAGWNVLKALYRLTPRGQKSHPMVWELHRFGQPGRVAGKITREVRAGAESFGRGRVVLTRSWLLNATLFHLEVIRLDDVVWAYKKVTQYRNSGLNTGREFAVEVRDARGWTWELRGREKDVDRLLMTLGARLPWIYRGYCEAWEHDWLLNRAAMLRAVEFRRHLDRQPADAG